MPLRPSKQQSPNRHSKKPCPNAKGYKHQQPLRMGSGQKFLVKSHHTLVFVILGSKRPMPAADAFMVNHSSFGHKQDLPPA